jgi:hypothetical protein
MSGQSVQAVAAKKRWRGAILELVYDGHCKQESRLDDLMLWGLMRDLRHDVGQNDVRTMLQQLGEMQYLRFKLEKNDLTNEVRLLEIEITRNGIALVEKVKTDELVRIL